MTVRNAHPEEIMVGDVCAPQCNEAYTTIQASTSRRGTASLCVKVNTRAGGNMLPFHVFQCLYPDQMSPAGQPTGLDHISTRLTAYNGSHIPLYGALLGPITWQPDHPGSWPHRVNSYCYVADTPGPAILGLPSSEKLAVVKMNCAITVRQPNTHPAPVSTTVATTKPTTVPEAAKSIRSTDDLIKEFPDQFKGIGRFPGKYKIWLHHDAHPVIHAPRRCPIALHPKVKEHLNKMGMPRCDNPCRWTNGLGILHYLHPEGKWWASSVPGSPWPQWGHLPWSSQDTHHGGSCSWVCHTPTSSLSWMPAMDTGQSYSTRTPACLWPSTAPLEDTISCDFPLAWSVPKTSSRKRWIQILEECQGCVLESQMTSSYTATLRQNMMPPLQNLMHITCKYDLVFNFFFHRKHM